MPSSGALLTIKTSEREINLGLTDTCRDARNPIPGYPASVGIGPVGVPPDVEMETANPKADGTFLHQKVSWRNRQNWPTLYPIRPFCCDSEAMSR
jgi:hypothetical protein